MTRIVTACTAIFALLLLSWGDAGAQYYPPGSYQGSCTHLQVNGSVLSGRCSGPNGGRFFSSIDSSRCINNSVRNLNGYLACGIGIVGNGPGPGYGHSGHLPPGSYRMSCSQISRNGPQLVATCPSANGTRIRSAIIPRTCRGGDIQNRNGTLTCVFG